MIYEDPYGEIFRVNKQIWDAYDRLKRIDPTHDLLEFLEEHDDRYEFVKERYEEFRLRFKGEDSVKMKQSYVLALSTAANTLEVKVNQV